jgi:hypothetical protein
LLLDPAAHLYCDAVLAQPHHACLRPRSHRAPHPSHSGRGVKVP